MDVARELVLFIGLFYYDCYYGFESYRCENRKINDLISVIMYLAALILWLIIVKTEKLMNWRVERFLIAFNHHAPSMIFISSLLFYLVVYLYTNRCIWIGVIVLSFFACIWLTCLWYKRENKYTTNE